MFTLGETGRAWRGVYKDSLLPLQLFCKSWFQHKTFIFKNALDQKSSSMGPNSGTRWHGALTCPFISLYINFPFGKWQDCVVDLHINLRTLWFSFINRGNNNYDIHWPHEHPDLARSMSHRYQHQDILAKLKIMDRKWEKSTSKLSLGNFFQNNEGG